MSLGPSASLAIIAMLTSGQTADQLKWSRTLELVPKYTQQLRSENADLRSQALYELEQLVPERDDDPMPPTFLTETLPLLSRIAQEDPVPRLRADAIGVIGLLGPRAGSAVPALTLMLSDRVSAVRRSAAEALGQMGPAADRAVAALRGSLGDTDARVRQAAAAALGALGVQEARPELRRALGDPDRLVRWQAKAALEALDLKKAAGE
jgi:HEAT repeat protein